MERYTLKLESLKSRFIFSQIIMVFAGFLFVTAGTLMTNSLKNLDSATTAAQVPISLELSPYKNSTGVQNLVSIYANYSTSLIGLARTSLDGSELLFGLGVICVALSITSYFKTKSRIEDLNYLNQLERNKSFKPEVI